MAALVGEEGVNLLHNLAECDDTFVMRRALSDCPDVVDIMAAGTAMRFLTSYYATTPGSRVITGTERMRNRPIALLVDALRSLGADIEYTEREGFPPLRIVGKSLRGGNIELPASVSSQYISSLLMIAPLLTGGLRLTLTGGIVSRSYIDMTLALMRSFGANAEWQGQNVIVVDEGRYTRTEMFLVESDWSAASYWYEVVALSTAADTTIRLDGLHRDSLQGDACVATLFEPLGVHTAWTADGVLLTKTRRTAERVDTDMTLCPDLAQTLVVACAVLGVPFRISGLQSLRIKETDRIAALQTELDKMGFDIIETSPGTLEWNGERSRPSDDIIYIDTYEDHRMAMAFAPAAFAFDGLRVRHPEVVTKSYPGFWEELRKVGFNITSEE